MRKLFTLLFLIIIVPASLFAQHRTEDFKLVNPDAKVSNSLYKTISFIDARYDTTNMGIVQQGAFNAKARVVPKIPLSTQLSTIVNALTDSSAKDGQLVLRLHQFYFAEITGAFSEKGYAYIRAELFSNYNDRFQKLKSIDTVLVIKSMVDVTKAMLKSGSKAITGFIADNLTQRPPDIITYSLNDVINMDSIEKSKIKLYNSIQYNDGLYENYSSFMKQVPDKPIKVSLKDGQVSWVKVINDNKEETKVKSKNIYAIVYKGQPYIATDYGYYPLEKRDNDYYFTGKAKVTANTGEVIAASVFFGVIGGLLASNSDATFEMKIDYVNGGFIRIKEVPSAINQF